MSLGGDPQRPPPPANAPTRADASVISAGQRAMRSPIQSLINTGSTGLLKKAKTSKPSLLGRGGNSGG